MSLLIKLNAVTKNPEAIKIPSSDIFQLVGPEPTAYEHWQFHSDSSSLTGLLNQKPLLQNVEAGSSVNYTDTNMVASMGQGVSSGWHTDLRYRDNDGYALCFVYRRPATDPSYAYTIGGQSKSNSNNVMSYANQTRYLGPALGSTYHDNTDEQWVFVCITQDNIADTTTVYTAGGGSITSKVATGSDPDNEVINLGGYLSGSNNSNPTDISYAECILFDRALTVANIEEVYRRSVIRMRRQGVALS